MQIDCIKFRHWITHNLPLQHIIRNIRQKFNLFRNGLKRREKQRSHLPVSRQYWYDISVGPFIAIFNHGGLSWRSCDQSEINWSWAFTARTFALISAIIVKLNKCYGFDSSLEVVSDWSINMAWMVSQMELISGNYFPSEEFLNVSFSLAISRWYSLTFSLLLKVIVPHLVKYQR